MSFWAVSLQKPAAFGAAACQGLPSASLCYSRWVPRLLPPCPARKPWCHCVPVHTRVLLSGVTLVWLGTGSGQGLSLTGAFGALPVGISWGKAPEEGHSISCSSSLQSWWAWFGLDATYHCSPIKQTLFSSREDIYTSTGCNRAWWCCSTRQQPQQAGELLASPELVLLICVMRWPPRLSSSQVLYMLCATWQQCGSRPSLTKLEGQVCQTNKGYKNTTFL